jgi:hypothetical protein
MPIWKNSSRVILEFHLVFTYFFLIFLFFDFFEFMNSNLVIFVFGPDRTESVEFQRISAKYAEFVNPGVSALAFRSPPTAMPANSRYTSLDYRAQCGMLSRIAISALRSRRDGDRGACHSCGSGSSFAQLQGHVGARELTFTVPIQWPTNPRHRIDHRGRWSEGKALPQHHRCDRTTSEGSPSPGSTWVILGEARTQSTHISTIPYYTFK